MNDVDILVILDSEGKYRQKITQYDGIDINIFIKELKKLKYNVEITNFLDVYQNLNNIKNKTIIYTASQNVKYKKYIEDIMFALKDDNILVPEFDSLLGQENKAYQELQRKKLKLDDLKSWTVSDVREINNLNLKYPIVIKKPNTCSGKGVYLAKNRNELNKIIAKKFIYRDLNYYKLIMKKNIMKFINEKSYKWFSNNINDYNYSRIVLQEFIPKLTCDYKILVFGDKYYGLLRKTKTGSFIASGSGIHDFESEIPVEVLNFAKKCYDKLNVPFAGLDIAIDHNKKCYLIEFQTIHIGCLTLINSKKYYVLKKEWKKIESSSCLEIEYAKAIDFYLKNKIL